MSAEVELLRRAARDMRRHAEDAHRGVWRKTQAGDVVLGEWNIIVGDHADARHIASWDPAVALAVADLLETIAEIWVDAKTVKHYSARQTIQDRTLTIAREYLGEQP